MYKLDIAGCLPEHYIIMRFLRPQQGYQLSIKVYVVVEVADQSWVIFQRTQYIGITEEAYSLKLFCKASRASKINLLAQ